MDKDVVKSIRDRLGMTQTQFARVMGVEGISVSRWENGHSEPSDARENELISLKQLMDEYSDSMQELKKELLALAGVCDATPESASSIASKWPLFDSVRDDLKQAVKSVEESVGVT